MNQLPLQCIKTLVQADSILDKVMRERKQKNHKAEAIKMKAETIEEKTHKIIQELEVAKAELASINDIIADLSEGITKEAEITKKLVLEVRIRKLTSSTSPTGLTSVVENEFELIKLQCEIDCLDEIISQINARKAELQ